ncbi:Sapep family Mn(2+)-dependent dipeptidase [Sporomusa sp. KB1]|jgi:succinyl-diaminopimelate desuccinylase|uniref:Sapep family Mn(2+)-dependent dipeptidase n=1 Tax=Sporomusa sp. KB1 TaxID=943346 RepID=UPI0011A2FD65|nr:Sapep family Mn(2+)-dependent dipeptidase [Sporomusa sp. KB1]TWH47529.1 succinyl-diaminopimelate desuccinylase [Sporomusa sp. KB1]
MAFKNEIFSVKDDIIATTQRLIQFNTVETQALPNAPFGAGNRAALNYVLEIGRQWGFTTKDLEGYAGYWEFGEGQDVVVIMPHLDVVPEGTDWDYPPFGGEIHNGNIYGRGAADNKGPAVAALYAFKLVRDSGLTVNKRIRLVFGCDEESGFECVNHYIKAEGLPTSGFTPDGAFPVINAEKGVLSGNFVIKLPPETAKLIFTGGTARNVVPAYAKAEFAGKSYEAIGVAAHASAPELGENAIIKLARELQQVGTHPVLEFITNTADPESLGIAAQDEISGPLTYNIGLIHVDEQTATLTVNIRYPVTHNAEEIIEKLKAAGQPYGFSFESYTGSRPHYVAPESRLIKNLLAAYAEITGTVGKPLAMGGGTYARVLGNFAAFGARFPGDPPIAHQKNEYISVDGLLKATEVYATAIYKLAQDNE